MAVGFCCRAARPLWCVDLPPDMPTGILHPGNRPANPSCRSLAARRRSAAMAAAAASTNGGQQPLLARSVRPIPITVITVDKGNSQGAEAMAAEWADKLRR